MFSASACQDDELEKYWPLGDVFVLVENERKFSPKVEREVVEGGGLPARVEEFLVLLMNHSSHRFLQKTISSNVYTQGQFPQST